MPRYLVTGDMRVPGYVVLEAGNLEEALSKSHSYTNWLEAWSDYASDFKLSAGIGLIGVEQIVEEGEGDAWEKDEPSGG